MPTDPVHPGIFLAQRLTAKGISQYQLAKALKVPLTRITAIIKGKRSITADTALRLGRYFETDPKDWLTLQGVYDLAIARDKLGDQLQKIVPYWERDDATQT